MEIKVTYNGLEDRQQKITENEALGYRMLHDDFDPSWTSDEEPYGTMTFTDAPEAPPAPTEPSYSTHISILVAVDPVKARPAKIKRVWEGRDYFYDCFATQTVKDEYVAGKILIGDYVLVHFDDTDEQIVTAKVFKSW